MSQTQPTTSDPLAWDLVDRLNKSLRVSPFRTSTDLAAALGVHRNTVSNYLSGRIKPDRRTLMAWALACGVPFAWLEGVGTPDANEAPTEGEGLARVRRQGLEPRTRYVAESASEDGIARILPADSNLDGQDSGFESPADVIQLPTWLNRPGIIRCGAEAVR